MAQLTKFGILLRSAFGPALAIVLLVLCAGYALLGPNGLLAYGDYAQALQKSKVELAHLQHRRDALKNRVHLLDPRHVDPDMADELIRKDLGVNHPDEVIIPMK